MSQPTFAAVIPARNAERTLRRAVESALGQSDPPVEVVVIDDGSSDATRDAVVDLEVILVDGPCRGVAAARNVGVRTTSADWVAFLDADDEWLEGHLAALRAAVGATPDAGVCFGGALHMGVPGTIINQPTISARWANRDGLLRRRIQPTTSATAASRAKLLAAGGFDEGFASPSGVEDIDLWWRLAAEHPCAVSPEPTVRYFVNEGRDRRRTREQLAALASDRRRWVARVATRVSPDLTRAAAAQSHAMMARYWYVAGFRREGRTEARASLRYAVSVDGMIALTFGLLPDRLDALARNARRSVIRWLR